MNEDRAEAFVDAVAELRRMASARARELNCTAFDLLAEACSLESAGETRAWGDEE